jgi:nitroimidazol reductase NimA-like FMN-containing flavoprotein (pyridoxamine 5'-phosphate oxidase superfamily)
MTLQEKSKEAPVMDVITGVIKTGHLCVLSTISGDRPYSSLMRYTVNDRCTEIYLVTHKNTTKYQNILKNPRVSLLMDTRTEAAISDIQALSIEGVAFTVADADKQATDRALIVDRFIHRHPDVAEFVRQPDAAVICVEVHEFQLLNGIRDAHRVKVTP